MSRSFLFGGSTSGQSQNKYLVEFRAGKMIQKGSTVHPDKRKGLVYVHQADDALMHLCWKDRTSGTVEDDLIIFPDDAEFKRVSQCTTGRVYVLKFKSNSRKCFYWMQEPKTEKDDDYCSKVNEYLNNPPVPGSSHSLAGSSSSQGSSTSLQSELSSLGDGDLQNLLNNMSQQQLVQLLGGMSGMGSVNNLSSLLGRSRQSARSSGSTPVPTSRPTSELATVERTPAATSTTTTSSTQSATATPLTTQTTSAQQASNIQLSDLQNILSGLNVPASQTAGNGTNIDLSSAITAEALQPLLNNAELMERIRNLLPPSEDTATGTSSLSEQVRSTVKSPQFQQALSVFSAALQSGQLGPLMLQFGMSPEVVNAANSGDMEAFIRALQASSGQQLTQTSEKGKEDKDEEMSLD